ncbi:MAG: type II toxin-antitoxin system MqsA family antitoxin [Candidatus Paracaedibacteraceae bacterium]|nr:type II toxin-antitoxin system MqsA family antitoxin [Candidatus Paracaedibacteraceae bacterium]
MNNSRNIGQEILEALKEIKNGKGVIRKIDACEDVSRIRQELNLSQSAFSSLMGISVRTLQEWEQGRRYPTGPALSLLRIAHKHPEAFVDL